MKKLKVGFDFDGVIVYNPIRLARLPISLAKRLLYKKTKISFFHPRNKIEEFLWLCLHYTSLFPSPGIEELKQQVVSGKIEAHLITGRYTSLHPQLKNWLKQQGLENTFKTLNLNSSDQPHLFKEKVINHLKLDFYVEDNLDIVKHLTLKCKTKIYWIYNILDRNYPYPHKFPHLRKAIHALGK